MNSSPGVVAALTVAHLTHPGLLRKGNEDSCGVSPDRNVFVVCDGMGGAAAGEVASQLAVQTFLDHLDPAAPPQHRLSAGIRAANLAVLRRARETHDLRGMGTTLVALLFEPRTTIPNVPGRLWVAHVGDSRCYLLRDRTLRLLTADHSLVEEQVRAGLLTRHEADTSSVRHIITRAIGSGPQVQPELLPLEACPGDLLLLTSDGLNRELTDPEIERLLNLQPDLPATCQALIDAANAHGGRDNITVLLLRIS